MQLRKFETKRKVRVMEGNLLPFVSAPDLEVNLLGQGGFTNMLCISHSEVGKIVLGAVSMAGCAPTVGHGFIR